MWLQLSFVLTQIKSKKKKILQTNLVIVYEEKNVVINHNNVLYSINNHPSF